jgi:putative ABC transport system permease protein
MSVPFDVQYGLRKLNDNVSFTTVAVLCLALGIGANVTVFSVVNALLLRPVPGVKQADRLVSIMTRPVETPEMQGLPMSVPLSFHEFQSYRGSSGPAFSELAAYHPVSLNLVAGGGPLRVEGLLVSDNYFTALGLESPLGRLFVPGEARREAQPEAVVSHDFWLRVLGGRDDALGRRLMVGGRDFAVIGVAPPGFRGTVHETPADLWVLLEEAPLLLPNPGLSDAAFRDPNRRWIWWLFGRLAPGMDAERAQDQMNVLAQRLGRPDLRPSALDLRPGIGLRPWSREDVIDPLLRLSAVAGLLMLVVCANLGGLLLVKAAARQEEIGVRLALGVTRWRLVRQLLTESLALSLLGGGLGLALALFALEALRGVSLGTFLPRLTDLPMDRRVLAFTLALSLGGGIVFGLVPALWASRPRVASLLRRGASPDPGRTRLQEAFVVGQVTASLVLLVSTGLFVRTLLNLGSVDPGFDSRGVLNLRIDLASQGYGTPSGGAFYTQLLEQVRGLPGVRAAALAWTVPLSRANNENQMAGVLQDPGAADPDREEWVQSNVVTPGYFRTLGIPLLGGRDFSARDRRGAPGVVIVSEALAARLWADGRNPVGERLRLREGVHEVVGVVRDVRPVQLQGDPTPMLYMPLAQSYKPSLTLHVRADGDPAALVEPIRAAMRKLDSTVPLFAVALFEAEVREASAQPRLFSWLLGSFSAIALLVTAIGLYGTLAYAVSRRTREMGIRMALGARGSEIISMVLKRGLTLTATGLALGLALATWTTSLFSNQLFGVTPTDPMVFLGVTLLLALVGVAASSLPAWSATRVDPMAVIRHE